MQTAGAAHMLDTRNTKTDSAIELERYKTAETHIVELMKATMAFEHAALKPLPILNGGAILATLTFAGHAKKGLIDFDLLKAAFVSWEIGLLAAVLAIFFGYLCQSRFLEAAPIQRDMKFPQRPDPKPADLKRLELLNDQGEKFRARAHGLAVVSFISFAAGSTFAIFALVGLSA